MEIQGNQAAIEIYKQKKRCSQEKIDAWQLFYDTFMMRMAEDGHFLPQCVVVMVKIEKLCYFHFFL